MATPARTPSDLNIGQLVKPTQDDLSNIPAHKPPPVELARKNLRWHKGKPQVVGHFKLPEFEQHRRLGSTVAEVLDLLKPSDVKRLNHLHRLAALDPEGKGPAILLFVTRQVVGDRWICLAEYQDVFYREVIPPAAIHDLQPIPKRSKSKHSPAD